MSREDRIESFRRYAHQFMDETPADRDAFMKYYESSFEAGALDIKTKRLMGMCGGLIAGCTGCILGQLDMALQHGATRQEVIEACAVAMSLGGTLAWSQITKVMEHLDAMGAE